MGERILVPFDGSPLSQRALEQAATKHPDSQITVLYVINPMLVMYEAEAEGLPTSRSWPDKMEKQADELCSTAKELAEEYGCEITTAVKTGRPAREILEYADEHDIEHIIMGSHGRKGVSRLILGSVAEKVMRQAPIPVTIVR